jgi:hypothetical protein
MAPVVAASGGEAILKDLIEKSVWDTVAIVSYKDPDLLVDLSTFAVVHMLSNRPNGDCPFALRKGIARIAKQVYKYLVEFGGNAFQATTCREVITPPDLFGPRFLYREDGCLNKSVHILDSRGPAWNRG